MVEENLWKTFISGLDIDFPEEGIEAPDQEQMEKDDDINGMLLKITFDVYMFMNHNQTKYYMMQSNQKLAQMGEMTLKEALLKFNKKLPKKRD